MFLVLSIYINIITRRVEYLDKCNKTGIHSYRIQITQIALQSCNEKQQHRTTRFLNNCLGEKNSFMSK